MQSSSELLIGCPDLLYGLKIGYVWLQVLLINCMNVAELFQRIKRWYFLGNGFESSLLRRVCTNSMPVVYTHVICSTRGQLCRFVDIQPRKLVNYRPIWFKYWYILVVSWTNFIRSLPDNVNTWYASQAILHTIALKVSAENETIWHPGLTAFLGWGGGGGGQNIWEIKFQNLLCDQCKSDFRSSMSNV